jgi:hypothetical protein
MASRRPCIAEDAKICHREGRDIPGSNASSATAPNGKTQPTPSAVNRIQSISQLERNGLLGIATESMIAERHRHWSGSDI